MATDPQKAQMQCATDPQLIHITHKHPALSYAYRKDLDPEVVVASYYPLALANKIIPFLENEPTRSTSPDHKPSTRIVLRLSAGSMSSITSSNSDTLVNNDKRSESPKRSRAALLKDNPTPDLMTPARQLLPTSSVKNGRSQSPAKFDTAKTSRTVSPGGTQFSPRKLEDTSPLPTRKLCEIPAASFSPPKTRATARSKRRKSPSPAVRQTVRHLIEYDPNPRKVDDHYAHPVLILRHDLDTTALSDIFAWAKESANAGKIVSLKDNLIKFRDFSRVHDIHEAAIMLGLKLFQAECEILLGEWENELDALQTIPIALNLSLARPRVAQPQTPNMIDVDSIRSASQKLDEQLPLSQTTTVDDFVPREDSDSDIPLASAGKSQGRGGHRGRGRGRGIRRGTGRGRGGGRGRGRGRGRIPKQS